jgi:hypothetical protein
MGNDDDDVAMLAVIGAFGGLQNNDLMMYVHMHVFLQ